ncbi:MAG: uridine kinase [Candidatus Ornithospirochaeta sp.]
MDIKERLKKVLAAFGSGSRVIAIDGRCAGGKSTLARSIEEVMDVSVIRMDDFFLPPFLRTPERFQTPGGNVHWERFLSEVVEPLSRGEDFSYRIFSCSIMDYSGERWISVSKPVVVEGSYALHPFLPVYWDKAFFLDVDKGEQLRRLQVRCPEKLEAFKNKWIPLEEEYFSAFGIEGRADEIL